MKRKIQLFPVLQLVDSAVQAINVYNTREKRFPQLGHPGATDLNVKACIVRLEATWKRAPFKRRSKFKLEHGNYTIGIGYDQAVDFLFKIHIRYNWGKNRRILIIKLT